MSAYCTNHRLGIFALAFAISGAGAWADNRADFDRAYAAYEQHVRARETEQALAAAKDAHRFGSKVFGKRNINTVNLAINYATLLNNSGDFKKARSTLKGKLRILQEHYGNDATQLVPIVIQLGRAEKDRNKALNYFERAARLSRGYDNNVIEAEKNFDIVVILLRQDRAALIEPFVDKAYEIYSDRLQPNDFRLGLMSYHKAKLAIGRNRYDEVIGYLHGSLAAFKGPAGRPMGDLERTVRVLLVDALEKLGQPDAATEHCLALGANQDWSPTTEPVYKQDPVFPPEAIENRIGGEVTLSFTIDEQGFVVNPTVSESNQTIFNEASLAMVQGFRYAPRFIDGTPVATPGIEYTASFAFAPVTANPARRKFQRPPLRGFAQPDFTDQSDCGQDIPDPLRCSGIGTSGRK